MKVSLTLAMGFALLTLGSQGYAQQYSGEPATVVAAAPGGTPAPAMAVVPSEGSACCGEACAAACGACNDPCRSCRWQFFGEYLNLEPLNSRVDYAVPMNGPIVPGQVPVQVGRTGIVEPEFSSGFRAGFARVLDDCSRVGVTYTQFDSSATDTTVVTDQQVAPVIVGMVLHPSIGAADNFWEGANATEKVGFKLVDLDYRSRLIAGNTYCVNYLVGARFAELDQNFESNFVRTGVVRTADANVDFDGGGLRLGLEAEKHPCGSGFLVYGTSAASFVAGSFRAHYISVSNVQDPLVVDTTWRATNLVSMLDLELGFGWASANNNLRLKAGYMFSGWYNVVKPSNYIRSVQANDDHPLEGADNNFLGFDGLVARAEVRF
jgi:hypothetical protein